MKFIQLARDVGQDPMAILEFDREHRVGERVPRPFPRPRSHLAWPRWFRSLSHIECRPWRPHERAAYQKRPKLTAGRCSGWPLAIMPLRCDCAGGVRRLARRASNGRQPTARRFQRTPKSPIRSLSGFRVHFRYRDRVLEVGREGAVAVTTVQPSSRTCTVVAAEREHRLDRQAHPGCELDGRGAGPVVRDLRVLVHLGADAVADELADDAEAVRLARRPRRPPRCRRRGCPARAAAMPAIIASRVASTSSRASADASPTMNVRAPSPCQPSTIAPTSTETICPSRIDALAGDAVDDLVVERDARARREGVRARAVAAAAEVALERRRSPRRSGCSARRAGRARAW